MSRKGKARWPVQGFVLILFLPGMDGRLRRMRALGVADGGFQLLDGARHLFAGDHPAFPELFADDAQQVMARSFIMIRSCAAWDLKVISMMFPFLGRRPGSAAGMAATAGAWCQHST